MAQEARNPPDLVVCGVDLWRPTTRKVRKRKARPGPPEPWLMKASDWPTFYAIDQFRKRRERERPKDRTLTLEYGNQQYIVRVTSWEEYEDVMRKYSYDFREWIRHEHIRSRTEPNWLKPAFVFLNHDKYMLQKPKWANVPIDGRFSAARRRRRQKILERKQKLSNLSRSCIQISTYNPDPEPPKKETKSSYAQTKKVKFRKGGWLSRLLKKFKRKKKRKSSAKKPGLFARLRNKIKGKKKKQALIDDNGLHFRAKKYLVISDDNGSDASQKSGWFKRKTNQKSRKDIHHQNINDADDEDSDNEYTSDLKKRKRKFTKKRSKTSNKAKKDNIAEEDTLGENKWKARKRKARRALKLVFTGKKSLWKRKKSKAKSDQRETEKLEQKNHADCIEEDNDVEFRKNEGSQKHKKSSRKFGIFRKKKKKVKKNGKKFTKNGKKRYKSGGEHSSSSGGESDAPPRSLWKALFKRKKNKVKKKANKKGKPKSKKHKLENEFIKSHDDQTSDSGGLVPKSVQHTETKENTKEESFDDISRDRSKYGKTQGDSKDDNTKERKQKFELEGFVLPKGAQHEETKVKAESEETKNMAIVSKSDPYSSWDEDSSSGDEGLVIPKGGQHNKTEEINIENMGDGQAMDLADELIEFIDNLASDSEVCLNRKSAGNKKNKKTKNVKSKEKSRESKDTLLANTEYFEHDETKGAPHKKTSRNKNENEDGKETKIENMGDSQAMDLADELIEFIDNLANDREVCDTSKSAEKKKKGETKDEKSKEKSKELNIVQKKKDTAFANIEYFECDDTKGAQHKKTKDMAIDKFNDSKTKEGSKMKKTVGDNEEDISSDKETFDPLQPLWKSYFKDSKIQQDEVTMAKSFKKGQPKPDLDELSMAKLKKSDGGISSASEGHVTSKGEKIKESKHQKTRRGMQKLSSNKDIKSGDSEPSSSSDEESDAPRRPLWKVLFKGKKKKQKKKARSSKKRKPKSKKKTLMTDDNKKSDSDLSSDSEGVVIPKNARHKKIKEKSKDKKTRKGKRKLGSYKDTKSGASENPSSSVEEFDAPLRPLWKFLLKGKKKKQKKKGASSKKKKPKSKKKTLMTDDDKKSDSDLSSDSEGVVIPKNARHEKIKEKSKDKKIRKGKQKLGSYKDTKSGASENPSSSVEEFDAPLRPLWKFLLRGKKKKQKKKGTSSKKKKQKSKKKTLKMDDSKKSDSDLSSDSEGVVIPQKAQDKKIKEESKDKKTIKRKQKLGSYEDTKSGASENPSSSVEEFDAPLRPLWKVLLKGKKKKQKKKARSSKKQNKKSRKKTLMMDDNKKSDSDLSSDSEGVVIPKNTPHKKIKESEDKETRKGKQKQGSYKDTKSGASENPSTSVEEFDAPLRPFWKVLLKGKKKKQKKKARSSKKQNKKSRKLTLMMDDNKKSDSDLSSDSEGVVIPKNTPHKKIKESEDKETRKRKQKQGSYKDTKSDASENPSTSVEEFDAPLRPLWKVLLKGKKKKDKKKGTSSEKRKPKSDKGETSMAKLNNSADGILPVSEGLVIPKDEKIKEHSKDKKTKRGKQKHGSNKDIKYGDSDEESDAPRRSLWKVLLKGKKKEGKKKGRSSKKGRSKSDKGEIPMAKLKNSDDGISTVSEGLVIPKSEKINEDGQDKKTGKGNQKPGSNKNIKSGDSENSSSSDEEPAAPQRQLWKGLLTGKKKKDKKKGTSSKKPKQKSDKGETLMAKLKNSDDGILPASEGLVIPKDEKINEHSKDKKTRKGNKKHGSNKDVRAGDSENSSSSDEESDTPRRPLWKVLLKGKKKKEKKKRKPKSDKGETSMANLKNSDGGISTASEGRVIPKDEKINEDGKDKKTRKGKQKHGLNNNIQSGDSENSNSSDEESYAPRRPLWKVLLKGKEKKEKKKRKPKSDKGETLMAKLKNSDGGISTASEGRVIPKDEKINEGGKDEKTRNGKQKHGSNKDVPSADSENSSSSDEKSDTPRRPLWKVLLKGKKKKEKKKRKPKSDKGETLMVKLKNSDGGISTASEGRGIPKDEKINEDGKDKKTRKGKQKHGSNKDFPSADSESTSSSDEESDTPRRPLWKVLLKGKKKKEKKKRKPKSDKGETSMVKLKNSDGGISTVSEGRVIPKDEKINEGGKDKKTRKGKQKHGSNKNIQSGDRENSSSSDEESYAPRRPLWKALIKRKKKRETKRAKSSKKGKPKSKKKTLVVDELKNSDSDLSSDGESSAQHKNTKCNKVKKEKKGKYRKVQHKFGSTKDIRPDGSEKKSRGHQRPFWKALFKGRKNKEKKKAKSSKKGKPKSKKHKLEDELMKSDDDPSSDSGGLLVPKSAQHTEIKDNTKEESIDEKSRERSKYGKTQEDSKDGNTKEGKKKPESEGLAVPKGAQHEDTKVNKAESEDSKNMAIVNKLKRSDPYSSWDEDSSSGDEGLVIPKRAQHKKTKETKTENKGDGQDMSSVDDLIEFIDNLASDSDVCVIPKRAEKKKNDKTKDAKSKERSRESKMGTVFASTEYFEDDEAKGAQRKKTNGKNNGWSEEDSKHEKVRKQNQRTRFDKNTSGKVLHTSSIDEFDAAEKPFQKALMKEKKDREKSRQRGNPKSEKHMTTVNKFKKSDDYLSWGDEGLVLPKGAQHKKTRENKDDGSDMVLADELIELIDTLASDDEACAKSRGSKRDTGFASIDHIEDGETNGPRGSSWNFKSSKSTKDQQNSGNISMKKFKTKKEMLPEDDESIHQKSYLSVSGRPLHKAALEKRKMEQKAAKRKKASSREEASSNKEHHRRASANFGFNTLEHFEDKHGIFDWDPKGNTSPSQL